MLSRLRPIYGLRLIVCYIHHGIRTEAGQEAAFVRQEAERRQCLFAVRYTDVPLLARQRRISIETAGRQERYRLLRDVAGTYGAAAIAVAHHQNDQAETVLLHLLRGSGMTGLAAMKPRTGDIIRPFLCVTRQHIEAYIQDCGLTPCHDRTNEDPAYTRNRIRLELLPALKTYNPAIVSELNRLACIAQGEEAFLASSAADAYAQYVRPCQHGVCVEKVQFLAQPLAMQRRLLRLMCRNAAGTERNLPFQHIETMRDLAKKGGGKQFQTGILQVYTTRRDLCVTAATAAQRRRRT